MNPVDKITDPSFTNTAKGLLTLFCIGLAHTVIGVELTDAKIAVPWFPTINFPHPERIAYLYWGLILFAVYRYSLYHKEVSHKLFFNSLFNTLNNTSRGDQFIKANIYSDSLSYQLEKVEDGNEEIIRIVHLDYIEHSDDPDDYHWEEACFFDLKYTQGYELKEITFQELNGFQMDGLSIKSKGAREDWGMKVHRSHEEVYFKSSKIKSITLKFKLTLITLPAYYKTIIGDKQFFDTFVPVYFNLALLLYWVINLT